MTSLESTTSQKTKRSKIPLEISAVIKQTYLSPDEEEKFILHEKYNSPQNINVKMKLMSLINEGSEYDNNYLQNAIHARYAHEKRQQNITDETKLSRKVITRRHTTFASCKSIAERLKLHPELIATLQVDDMSDYHSDDLDDELFHVKEPAWRTEIVRSALRDIDSHRVIKKRRLPSSPSKRVKRH